MRCMVECTPINALQLFWWPITPFHHRPTLWSLTSILQLAISLLKIWLLNNGQLRLMSILLRVCDFTVRKTLMTTEGKSQSYMGLECDMAKPDSCFVDFYGANEATNTRAQWEVHDTHTHTTWLRLIVVHRWVRTWVNKIGSNDANLRTLTSTWTCNCNRI